MTDRDCIFCKIIRGEIPCAKVHETDTVLAFLDIAPVNKGHVLVVPKEHHADMTGLPPSLGPDLFEVIGQIGRAQLEGLGAHGFNVMMNNKKAAGQVVPHAHWHVIPRFTGDGLTAWPQKNYEHPEEINQTARKLSGLLR